MADLDIIKQIEQEIGRKLRQISLDKVTSHPRKNGYAVDENNNVIGLNLDKSNLYTIPHSLSSLKNLQKLSLYDSKIEQLPDSFAQLQNLSELDLSNNELKELPASFGQLQNLSELWLSNNKLKELPASFGQLQNLSELDLSNNELKELPASFRKLQNLCYLNLRDNQLKKLPVSFGKLKKLQKLILKSNCLEVLSEDLGLLKNLKYLDLSINKLTTLPKSLGNLESPCQLHVRNNPLETPPPEIVNQGTNAIRNYFNSLEQKQKPLHEIKILLVGDGGVGKTSLVKNLLGEKFDQHESQTHGINIKPYYIPTQNKQGEDIEVKANLWDFGGQEIMHSTHQFFLSKRSLYILVLDGRKEQKTEYWLKHIESFGDDSPILVIINKVDENPGFEVDRPFLKRKYQGIHSFHRVSCKKPSGIKTLQKSLTKALNNIEMLQTVWGQSWFNVKTELENLQQHYISYEFYKNLCEQQNILDSAQTTLVHFLRDLGIILHFDEFDLCDTYVLEPKWVTEAVYKIINSPQLAQNKGVLQLNWLNHILNDEQYPRDKYHYIIRLMEKFELCYKIEGDKEILIPDLLEVQEAKFKFDYDNALKFKLEYNFLPRSIMPRFIVKRHKEILEQLRWRTGVVLYDKIYKAVTVIKADNEDKHIQIWVTGQQKRDYFATVRKTLLDIHSSFEKMDVTELVPLPDKDRKGETVYVEYEELIGYYEAGRDEYFVGKLQKEYSVKKLLDGIENTQQTQANISYNTEIHGDVTDSNINQGDKNRQTTN